MYMVTAIVAGVRGAADHAMMFGHSVAMFTKDAIWIQVTLEPF
jgi:hypothetical protein